MCVTLLCTPLLNVTKYVNMLIDFNTWCYINPRRNAIILLIKMQNSYLLATLYVCASSEVNVEHSKGRLCDRCQNLMLLSNLVYQYSRTLTLTNHLAYDKDQEATLLKRFYTQLI